MARKKRTSKTADKPAAAQSGSAFRGFLDSPRAKWLFFGIYLLVALFMFREFIFSDDMLFGSDTIPDGIYTRSYYKEYHAEHGGIPRWNPFILGGLPFIDAMHGDTFYPGAWLKFFMPLTRALGHKLVWHVFFAGVFMYLFLRTLQLRRVVAFLGGLAYMCAPSFISLVYPGHDAKMYIIALLPLAFTFLERGMNRPRPLWLAALGGTMGLLILTSHVQMAYYSYWALGLYFLFRLFADGDLRSKAALRKLGLFAGAVVLAVALGAVQLLPSYEFTTSQSVRAGEERTGYDYATSWSMHAEETVGMLIPSFPGYINGGRGQENANLYWGRNFFKLNTEYHGIMPVVLAVLALVFVRTKRTWFFAGLGALSLIYALGANTPAYRLFYALVPGVKNFRAPGMIIFLFQFAIVCMGALFLHALFEGAVKLKRNGRGLLVAAGGVALAALLLTVSMGGVISLWRSTLHRDLSDARLEELRAVAGSSEQTPAAQEYSRVQNLIENAEQSVPHIIRDMWMVTVFSIIVLLMIWLYVRGRTTALAVAAVTAAVMFVDGSMIGGRFITTFDPDTYYGTTPDTTVRVLQDLMTEQPPFRVLTELASMYSLHSANYYAMFGIHSANGAHNNELQTYERFKGGRSSMNFFREWLDPSFDENRIGDNNFLKVANVRYIVVPNQDGGTSLLENEAAFERVFAVYDHVSVPNDSAAVALLADPAFDPERAVIIEGESDLEPGPALSDSAAADHSLSLSYSARWTTIRANLPRPGFVVLSDNWVPYWRAYVDGKETDIFRAYGTFMAVECPAGNHEIAFRFESEPYRTGKRLTLSSLGIIVVMLGTSLFVDHRRRKAA